MTDVWCQMRLYMINDWYGWLLMTDDYWIVTDDDEIQSDYKTLSSTALGHDQSLWLPLV